MRRVALVSDTHVPTRASGIPGPFEDRIREADHVVHAGDFTDSTTLERVRELADGSLTAVRGNMDRGLDLPDVDTLDVEGVTFVVTHGTGDRSGYEDRVANLTRSYADESVVGVAGHTHEVLDRTYDGVRLLNPGTVTGAPPGERATMMTAKVEAGELDVRLHEL